MRKKVKKRIALSIIFCIFLSACQRSGEKKSERPVVTTSLSGKPVLVGSIPIEFPLVKNDASLNVLITSYNGQKSADNFVWKKYREMTGVTVSFTDTTKSEREEAVYQTLMNKKDCDLIFRCKLAQNELAQYGENGLILDLFKDDLLKNNAPNCYAFLQSHPDALASVQSPNGSVYSIPQVNSGAELRVSRKLFVNKHWLEKVNLPLPTTTDELYTLLKAFKEQDANGNGDPEDEIPLCSIDYASIQEAFLGSFGLMNRGLHNQTVDFDEETGKVRLIKSSERYRAYLEYFAKLYSEKLMDNFIFTMTIEQWVTNALNDRIGVFSSTNLASLPASKIDHWIAIEEPLTGPYGDKMWSAIRANFHSTGAAVIPATCKDPALVLRWLDYFWTDEGTLFYHMGIEGESFVVSEDGTYDYSDKVYREMNENNISFDDAVSLYSPYPGGSNPTVETAPYFNGGEMAEIPANAARKLFPYGPSEYWPSFTFTPEESERLAKLESDIFKYTQYTRVGFISGLMPFHQWEHYTTELKKLGEDELVAIYQAAVDRYYNMQK